MRPPIGRRPPARRVIRLETPRCRKRARRPKASPPKDEATADTGEAAETNHEPPGEADEPTDPAATTVETKAATPKTEPSAKESATKAKATTADKPAADAQPASGEAETASMDDLLAKIGTIESVGALINWWRAIRKVREEMPPADVERLSAAYTERTVAINKKPKEA